MSAPSELPRFAEAMAVLRQGKITVDIEADSAERRAISQRLGLHDLRSLRARIELVPWQERGIEAHGEVDADFVQSCVVTLEPIESRLTLPIAARYQPLERNQPQNQELTIDIDDEDPPECLPFNGRIDLGELIIQHLAVALDPYPKKPGVAFGEAGANEIPQTNRPFAKLANLKSIK